MADKARLATLLLAALAAAWGREDLGTVQLRVYPEPENPANVLVRRVDQVLNLTCLLSAPSNATLAKYDLSWYLPLLPHNSLTRVSKVRSSGSLQLVVTGLQESDSGDYQCDATSSQLGQSGASNHSGQSQAPTHFPTLHRSVRVQVKPRRGACGDNRFSCPSGECIPHRYMCDGIGDCRESVDESHFYCGKDPCADKLRCEDGRCISRRWCCDRYTDPNCTVTVLQPCCQQVTPSYGIREPIVPSHSQHYNDMVVFQTTVYTIIGSAMAFLFIVTIVGVAICRVHIKRSVMSRHPLRHLRTSQNNSQNNPTGSNSGQHAPNPILSEWDEYIGRTSAPRGLMVTYNINNGVQYVASHNAAMPLDPPPYCELVTLPPREGPPPPYTSTESLHLLHGNGCHGNGCFGNHGRSGRGHVSNLGEIISNLGGSSNICGLGHGSSHGVSSSGGPSHGSHGAPTHGSSNHLVSSHGQTNHLGVSSSAGSNHGAHGASSHPISNHVVSNRHGHASAPLLGNPESEAEISQAVLETNNNGDVNGNDTATVSVQSDANLASRTHTDV